MATERLVPKGSKNYRIKLIGSSGATFSVVMGADDFTDNREKPPPVEHQIRGEFSSITQGARPARTGSFTTDFYTENNGLATAFLDVIQGNGSWSSESTGTSGTGQPGDPYIPGPSGVAGGFHVLDMEVTVLGSDVDGGNMVRTYSKVYFEPKETASLEATKIAIAWKCWGTVTGTGPS